MQSLVEALAQSLHPGALHVGVQALALRYRGPWRWQACWQVGQRRLEDTFERVVLTVPTHALEGLNLQADTPQHLSLWQTHVATLKALPYTALGCLTLGVSQRHLAHPAQGFGFLVPAPEPFPLLGTLFNASMFEHRAPQGYTTLASFVDSSHAALDNPQAVGQCVRHTLHTLMGLDPAGIAFEHYTHWPRAVPQYTLDHDRYLHAAQALEAALPGLRFKANWRGGVAAGECLAGLG
jgi:oxygen-dependent protoporphyrinogen oxidase